MPVFRVARQQARLAAETMKQDQPQSNMQIATLAGGCFWCLEAVYERLAGVANVESGYMGGHTPTPSYREVCNGDTGHAEVVQVTFDPRTLSFRDLLDVFFAIHDPTTLNRQDNDVGTQYRSSIFYHSSEQKAEAEKIIAELTADRAFKSRIVTEVVPAEKFYIAEKYHQAYFENNPNQTYCRIVIAPKLAKFMAGFSSKIKKD
jgi:peptide-methionine (S)-S-oxide reductase